MTKLNIVRSTQVFYLDKELLDLELDPIAFRVYVQLEFLLCGTGSGTKLDRADEEIAQMCRITVSQYKKALRTLVAQGLVEKINGCYALLAPEYWGRKAEPPSRPAVPGFIYIAKSGDKYKIGRSKNPVKRVQQLQTASANSIELVCEIPCQDMAQLESYLHEKFSWKRIRGEWFALSDADVASIQARAAIKGGMGHGSK